MTDQLTGIANRRRHERYSAAKWREALRLQIPFSVCMFDIDHFKVYNDTFGHPAGDKAISAVARTAAAHMKPGVDFLARYGGEEFIMLSMGDSAGAIFARLKLIRQAVEDLHIPHNPAVSQWLTVSMGGVTIAPPTGCGYAFFLQVADAMLYDAKRFGRNQVVWADEQLRQLCETGKKADPSKLLTCGL